MSEASNTRREFLTAKPFREAMERAAEEMVENADDGLILPDETIRLATVAMASDFEVIFPAGGENRLGAASDALELISRLEDQMSIFRPHSELSRLNALAAEGPVAVELRLFGLLKQAVAFAEEFDGAFDPTSTPLVWVWRRCKQERRIPTDAEIAAALDCVGRRFVELNDAARTIRLTKPGVELNLNAMGKGYAVDRAGEVLEKIPDAKSAWLLHGGHSSILGRGGPAGGDGWPVGIRHPLFPGQTLATLHLKNRGMSTSGAGVRFFRHGGKKYGHIIDPRTGWPAEEILSVTVLAPTAAQAEALSTAFFVVGVEKAVACCHNRKEISALIIPAPDGGQRLEPVACGFGEGELVFDSVE